MKLRFLVLAALACAACSIPAVQFACPTPGAATGCGTNQVCGPDRFCTTKVECKVNIEASCNGACINITNNRENCGGCGTACGPSQQCAAGKCTDFCAPGQTACQQPTGGFICENLSSDRSNCGTCGNVCAQGKVCSPPTTGAPGQCTTECIPGLTNCSGSCLDLNTDDANCGACTTASSGAGNNACRSGTHCVSGHCSVICTPGTTECPAGSGKCVDTTKDRDNCGGCAGAGGRVCVAGFVCSDSSCGLSCQSGLSDCVVSGAHTCVNTAIDAKNCGGCGISCNPALGQVCTGTGAGGSGQCGLQCATGETQVQFPPWKANTAYFKGNEVINAGNLYQVSTAGTSLATGTGPSSTGTGPIADASVVWSFVSAAPAGNLHCADLQTDRNNCGAPDDAGNTKACADGEVCIGGLKVVSCANGLSPCNSTCVDTNNDPTNCGTCGKSCGAASSAGPVCGNGQCGVSCPQGQVLCGSKCVDPVTDSQHCNVDSLCGGGRDCTAIGQVCQDSGCKLQCPAGSVPCNGTCIDPQTDNANCGASGSSCGGGVNCAATGKVCSAGVCSAVCVAPLSACPSTGTPSYCANKQSDPANCGTCANVCPSAAHATAWCASGNCGATCDPGYDHCSGVPAELCETNLTNSPAHCGNCTTACPLADNAGPVCANSACSTTCQGGFADCDGDPLNGCESDKTHDAANCNSCGSICSGTTPYCASGCVALAGAAGVQENLSAADIAADWGTPCFSESYSHVGTSLASIASTSCTGGSQVLIACQAPGASTLVAAAFGSRTNVFGGGGSDPVFYVPGTGVRAFGFAPAGASAAFTVSGTNYAFDVGGSASDGFAGGAGSQRISWPVSGGLLTAGGRCGDRTGSSGTSNYLRLVYTK